MKVLTLDFETFYSKEYSLRSMSTAEYILDQRFQCTGLAIKRGEGNSEWVHGQDVEDFFKEEPEDVLAVSHNALFDMSICAWRYGWKPKMMVDTLGVARALLAKYLRSLSLDKIGEFLKLGRKTGVLSSVLGMRREDIQARPALYESFIDYGLNDTDICYGIFKQLVMSGQFPMSEIKIMDMVLRMTVQPQFVVNTELLHQSLNTIKTKKEETLVQAMMLGADDKGTLMSNDKFAGLLRQYGVEPPMKISGTTGKQTYAFAKSDQAFLDLLEHPNIAVQTLVGARMGHKSTIEETRHERFIAIANLEWPAVEGPSPVTTQGYRRLMPIPLKYSGAHTHRLSGDWKLNLQNMGRGSALRASLCAPEGYVIVAGDESQIEARGVCTLAGQEDMRLQFENKQDVYSIFASGLFGREISKADKVERFIGKQCLAADTLVLTNKGWVPIVYLTTDHKVWDGIEWVHHEGLLPQGVKPTTSNHGLTMTSDHEILTERGWLAWSEVHPNHSLFQSALSLVSLPSQDGSGAALDTTPPAVVHAAKLPNLTGITLSGEEPADATIVQSALPQSSGTQNTNPPCQTTPIGLGYSTDCLQPLADATTQETGSSTTMEEGASRSTSHGGTIETSSLDMSKPCPDGTGQNLTWTGKITTGGMSPAIYGLPQNPKTYPTNVKSENCKPGSQNLKPVYDIANAGPRRRFTVMSSKGPIIVHNCILGLGYGLGKDKFSYSLPVLAFNQMGIDLPYTLEDGTAAVNYYRTKNHKIAETWKLLNTMGIRALTGQGDWWFGPVLFRKEEIVLPNGLKLYYHNIRQVEGGKFGFEWVFDYNGITKRVYGGMLLENITQALARIIVMDAAVRVEKHLFKLGIRLAHQVHDELVFVVRKEHEKITRYVLEAELRRRPEWLPNLPLDCEVGSGINYGEVK